MTIGETLARARHDSGLSVGEVSSRTSVTQSVVNGIEHNDFTVCGGDLYARHQIRAIAGALGVPAGPLVDEYEATLLSSETSPAAWAADPILAGEITEPIPAVQAAEPVMAAGPGVPAGPVVAAGPDRADQATGVFPARSTRARRVRGNWIALLGAALLAAAVFGGYQLAIGARGQVSGTSDGHAGRHDGNHVAAPTGGSPDHRARQHRHAPAATARNGHSVHVLRAVRVVAFGPGGVGQGDHPQLAHLALRGHAASPWHSSWYATPHFGNLQSGTGLVMEMGRKVTVTAASIALGHGRGANIELRVGNALKLTRLRPVARARGVGGMVRLHPRQSRGRYVLLWFTKLPRDHDGTFKASVYKITLIGYQPGS